MLNVYQFEYDVEGGDGIALIAAESEEKAMEFMPLLPEGFGHWVYDGIIHGLMYNGAPGVLREMSYAE